MSDLLTSSTTAGELNEMCANKTNVHCPYLRLRLKPMDKNEWIVEGQIHNGAHFPLCVFTHNASARSKEACVRRSQ